MKRIGLLSDTHDYLDPAVFDHFVNCDEVWHCGDFGAIDVVRTLQNFKPLRGVYGNIDDPLVRRLFPEVLHFSCEQVNVLMVHIGGYPKKYSTLAKAEIIAHKPQLFISGHSHILKIMYDEQYKCLHINPGAAGRQGWHKVRTLVRFEIEGSGIKNCEVVELGKR